MDFLRCFPAKATLPGLFSAVACEAEVVSRVIWALQAGMEAAAAAAAAGGQQQGTFAPWALDVLEGLAGTKSFATTALMLSGEESAGVRAVVEACAGWCDGGRVAALKRGWGL